MMVNCEYMSHKKADKNHQDRKGIIVKTSIKYIFVQKNALAYSFHNTNKSRNGKLNTELEAKGEFYLYKSLSSITALVYTVDKNTGDSKLKIQVWYVAQ